MKTLAWIQLTLLTSALFSLVACQAQREFGLPGESSKFGQPVRYNNKVDILFISDDSASMLQHQERLSSQMDTFTNYLLGLNLDFHFAVITTDAGGSGSQGRFLGYPRVLTSATSNITQQIRERIIVGETGSNLERGLQSMQMALSPANLDGSNAGFLRDDAQLVIIVLSDEDDYSAESVDYYVDFLDTLKGRFEDGSRAWTMHFIGVLALTGQCRTYNEWADPGYRYMEMVEISGGVSESICEADLRMALSNIRTRIVQIMTDFALDRRPVISTIRVWVDGQLLSNDPEHGWIYLADTNSIRFTGDAVPSADSDIRVDFQPLEAN